MSKLKKLLICLSLSLGSCSHVRPAPITYIYQMQMNPELACYRFIIKSQDPLELLSDKVVELNKCNGLLGVATEDQPSMAAWIKYAQKKLRDGYKKKSEKNK